MIMVYEGEDILLNLQEILTILNSDFLKKVPLLVLLNQKAASSSINQISKLRFELLKQKIKFRVQYINFENYSESNEINYGIEWLENQI